MDYRFDITLTEADYLDFNRFHVLESAAGKKVNRKGKLTILAVFLGLILLELVGTGWNADFFFYLAIMVPLGILSICFFNKLELFMVKLSIRQLKKRGKLPFDEQTTYEFYEDKFVQTVPDSRMEQSYSGLERICVVPDRMLLLYRNSSQAFVLPISQLRQQADLDGFIRFLSQKCGTVEYS